ncbi:MAG TPA: CBS domain-containing protein [Archaeoglobaceae archaeon]|nr:CBS domain-containing protein [Archaeoglobaceae archaeon]
MDAEVLKELISEDFEVVNANETISRVVPLLDKYDPDKSNAILVEESGKIVGVIREKDLMRGSLMVNPHETKIKNFIVKTGIIDISELTPEKVARRFVEDSTPFVLVKMGKKIGVIYVNDFLKKSNKDLKKMKIKDIMNPNVITIHSYDSAAKALATMRKYGIDRIVVVNEKNRAQGIVTGKDIIDRIISPRKSQGLGMGSGEKEKTLSIMVESIMSYPLITAQRNDDIRRVIELMLKNKISSVVIAKDGTPEGIVIKKDILETFLKKVTPTKQSVQIMTKDVELDEFDKQRIINDLEKFINKFRDFLGESILFAYIKRHKENFRGLPLIYVRLRLMSEKGVFFVTGESWGVEFAVNATLKKLEREVLQQKEILMDKRMVKRFYEEIF